MGTIFKYNEQLIQCKNLQKKLKKLKVEESNIEIIKDNIPNDILEKTFVELTKNTKEANDTSDSWHYFIFKNSKDNYLWGINKPSLEYIKNFGFDISDYKLIDECIEEIPIKYKKWNPETKTGIKSNGID